MCLCCSAMMSKSKLIMLDSQAGLKTLPSWVFSKTVQNLLALKSAHFGQSYKKRKTALMSTPVEYCSICTISEVDAITTADAS